MTEKLSHTPGPWRHGFDDVSGLDKNEIDDALFDIDNQFDLLIMKMERTIV